MRSNKLFVALLCIIMVLSMLLSSCNNTPGGTPDGTDTNTNADSNSGNNSGNTPGSDPDSTTDQSADTSPVDTPASVTLFEGGQAKFRLIRGDQASEQETNAALTVRKAILELFPDAKFEFTSDFSKDGTYDSDAVEILVGRTKHPECLSALTALRSMSENLFARTAIQLSCHAVTTTLFPTT